jgi:rod shape-determining protein MreC
MGGLLQLFIRYGGILLFFLLEGICFYLIVQFNQKQHQIYLSTSNYFVGKALDRYNSTISYFSLYKQMEALHAENALLRDSLDNTYYMSSMRKDTFPGDSLIQAYRHIPANVISKSMFGGNSNSITLDRGGMHGVKPGQGVVVKDGVVGIVVDTTRHFSRVMTIYHRACRISASIPKINQHGSLVYKGDSLTVMSLDAIPTHADVETGYIVETSGFSHKFPKGIKIGAVTLAQKGSDNNYNIRVKLATDITTVQQVYIIDRLMGDEWEQLEQRENEQ